jgi:exosortase/archaeosortase family protein
MINRLTTVSARLFDVPYLFKFLLRLLAFYLLFRLINWLMIGAIVRDGYYSSFIDNYLNYVTFIKVSVLQTASMMASLFDVTAYLVSDSRIKIEGSSGLFMAWSCCGLEIMSFWAAFALADTTNRRMKVYWVFGGLLCIWFINCIRVTILLIAVKNNWPSIGTLRHHDTFNIVAYSLVFLMMFVYYLKNKKNFGD